MIIGSRVTQGRSRGRLGSGRGSGEESSSQFISNHLQLSACLGPFFFFFFLRQRNKVLLHGFVFLGTVYRHFLEERTEITQNICLEELAFQS